MREIARWYQVSEKAIRNKAKAEGWVRQQSATGPQPQLEGPKVEDEPRTIHLGTVLTPENATAEAIVGRGRNLVYRMLDELDATTCADGEMASLIEAAFDGQDEKVRDAARQAVSLKNRSEILKSLATAAKTFQEAGEAKGVKQARQERGERVARESGRFAVPPGPRSVQ